MPKITQTEQRLLPRSSHEGWREILVLESSDAPPAACTRCPAAGLGKRKLNGKMAVECNVLAMPNQHMLCQGRLGTAVGQPKICYIPKPSRTETPDT